MKQEQKRKRISKRMKELRGKLRQKNKGGNYYYRLTIANGLRKEFALKTSNEDEAVQKAADLDAVYEAPNQLLQTISKDFFGTHRQSRWFY